MNDLIPVLTFRLDDQTYALHIDYVVEVMAMVTVQSVAGARPEVLGMVNRHGVPMILLDMRLALGKQAAGTIDASTLFVVVMQGDRYAGLVVDEIYQVDYLQQLSPAPQGAHLIFGIASDHDSMVQLIAVDAVLAAYLPGKVEV
jgi:chemotaxis signal transduction protein